MKLDPVVLAHQVLVAHSAMELHLNVLVTQHLSALVEKLLAVMEPENQVALLKEVVKLVETMAGNVCQHQAVRHQVAALLPLVLQAHHLEQ